MNEETLFHLARQKPASERPAFLAQACGDDGPLRRRVEALLQADEHPGSFMQQPAVSLKAAGDKGPDEPTVEGSGGAGGGTPPPNEPGDGPGSRVRPYRLLRPIGEGGMGAVFLAEQTQPVQRLVALKVIKPGLDSRQVVARFEAERQALALMDHPNIAKVLDGGTTETGRPFFVMELVQGQPITRYCDERRLSVRERLELVVPVCQAVQHAHQKGVIHRDLKPSNVLVALCDGRAVPKVIDFGVAKATGPRLTERTLYTEVGAVVGTPEYMSPEQAQLNPLDVDTRSDIFALGVMLYELLTGTTPLDRERLKEPALLEVLRIIREEEPPRPSARLGTMAAPASVAANRGLEPRKLSRLLRGELDWIVMKCLEKDPDRRYETANALALDLQRYLHDEAVQACPPSAGYRLRKFARRHKAALLAVAVLAGTLLAGVGVVAGSIGWALSDRAAREAVLEGQADDAVSEARQLLAAGRLYEAKAAGQRADGLLASGGESARVRERVAQLWKDLAMVERLQEVRLERAAVSEVTFDAAAADASCADAFRSYGIDVESLGRGEVVELIAASGIRVELAVALDDWALARRNTAKASQPGWEALLDISRSADPDPLRARLRAALAADKVEALSELAAAPDVLDLPPTSLGQLAEELRVRGRVKQAVGLLRGARDKYPNDFWINEHLGLCYRLLKPPREDEATRFYAVAVTLRPESPGAHQNLGVALGARGAHDEAIAELRRAVQLAPRFALAHSNLGINLCEKGEVDEAIACHERAIELRPRFAEAHNNLGLAFFRKRRLDDAIASYRKAIEINPRLAEPHMNLGLALAEQRKWDDAIESLRRATKIRPDYVAAHDNLGSALVDRGRPDQAIASYERALRIDPKYDRAHYNLGNILLKLKRLDDAIASFRRSIALRPDYALAHNNLGNAFQQKGLLDEAVACYEEALRLEPNLALIHFNLGRALQLQTKLEAAVASYRQVIKIDPNYAKAYVNLGVAYKALGRPEDSITAYREALKLEPGSIFARSGLGYAYLANGQPDEAIARFQEVIKADPSHAGAHNGLGLGLTRQHKWPEAIAAFEKASRLGPAESVAHANLAWWLANCPEQKLRDPSRARAVARKAAQLAPQSATARQALGYAHYRMGAWKDSIEELEKVIALQEEGNAWQWFLLAMAHWQLGHKDEARKLYDQAARWMGANAPRDEQLRSFRDEASQLMGLKESFD
jgi:tetratricopeptide (TPR) repeat protein